VELADARAELGLVVDRRGAVARAVLRPLLSVGFCLADPYKVLFKEGL